MNKDSVFVLFVHNTTQELAWIEGVFATHEAAEEALKKVGEFDLPYAHISEEKVNG